MYPPLTLQTGDAFPITLFAIHLMGISLILGSINVIVTIQNLRAPGMSLLQMPLFVWGRLITAYMLISVMPVLAGAVTLLLADHYSGPLFQRRRRRGPGDVSAHLLVLRASGGVHQGPAGVVCREFGISRKTGYKLFNRFGVIPEIIAAFSRNYLRRTDVPSRRPLLL